MNIDETTIACQLEVAWYLQDEAVGYRQERWGCDSTGA